MFDKIKNLFKKPKPVKQEEPKSKKKLNPKEEATAKGEPYINIVKMEVDPTDIHNGSFELDWNDKFILNLIRAGYKMKEDEPDTVIVDRWFQQVCKNIALEMYEQTQADPNKRDLRQVVSKDIGNGRSEVS